MSTENDTEDNSEFYAEYDAFVQSKLSDPASTLEAIEPRTVDLWHAATGVATECGELAEAMINAEDHELLMEELGDLEFYLSGVRHRLPTYTDGLRFHLKAPSCAMTLAAYCNVLRNASPTIPRDARDAVNGAVETQAILELLDRADATREKYYTSVSMLLLRLSCDLLDAVKRVSIYQESLDVVRVGNLLAHFYVIINILRRIHCWTREEVLEANRKKLDTRYREQFTPEEASVRRDKLPTGPDMKCAYADVDRQAVLDSIKALGTARTEDARLAEDLGFAVFNEVTCRHSLTDAGREWLSKNLK
jgi:hypothetical protein